MVQKSQEGWGVGENSLTNSKVRASCWRRDLRAWWGTELDPGKASLFVVAEQGLGTQVLSQFQVGQMMAAVAQGTRQEDCELLMGTLGCSGYAGVQN